LASVSKLRPARLKSTRALAQLSAAPLPSKLPQTSTLPSLVVPSWTSPPQRRNRNGGSTPSSSTLFVSTRHSHYALVAQPGLAIIGGPYCQRLLTSCLVSNRTTYVHLTMCSKACAISNAHTGGSPQDCFYASVFEHENPALRSLPLAVQQKQIVVTCNYEARRRGLHKLQLIHEAKKVCPDVVIVLGEDLTRFRNASKELYAFLRSFSWNSRCERLGFDEVCLFLLCLSTAPFPSARKSRTWATQETVATVKFSAVLYRPLL
jgi:hypothetical protein